MLCAGVFLSCKKDLIPIITQPAYNDLEYGWIEEQDDTTFQQVGLGNLSPLGMQFRYPQFNPSNPNEVIFVKQHLQENIHQLIKYNLKTKKQTILVDGMHINREPSWSSSGWIAFIEALSWDLYMIKDDGSQLTLLSQSLVHRSPRWSPCGEFLYFGSAMQIGHNPHLLKLNRSTFEVDTIYRRNVPDNPAFLNAKISTQHIMFGLSSFNGQLVYLKTNLLMPYDEIEVIFNIDDFELGDTMFFSWASDENFVYLSYSYSGRIYKVHLPSKEITLIRDRYHGTDTETIDVSPDGKYLAVERVELRNRFISGVIDQTGSIMESKIQLTDLATGKIKILDL
jgi:Tol biopolymer transport system component